MQQALDDAKNALDDSVAENRAGKVLEDPAGNDIRDVGVHMDLSIVWFAIRGGPTTRFRAPYLVGKPPGPLV